MKYQVVNPATGQLEREFPTATDAEISEVLARTERGYSSWRHTPKAERADTLRRVAQLYRDRSGDLGAIITREMGKTTAEAKGELKFTIRGKKLRGSWVLIRTRGNGRNTGKSWLLIKHRDRYASKENITVARPKSVLTGRLLAEIARDAGGSVAKAAKGDPAERFR